MYSNKDESQIHCAKPKELDLMGYTPYDSICMTFLQRQNHWGRKEISACQGLGERFDYKETGG